MALPNAGVHGFFVQSFRTARDTGLDKALCTQVRSVNLTFRQARPVLRRRNPMLWLRLSGLLLRLADRQFLVPPPAGLFQLPPRFTRFEPDTAVTPFYDVYHVHPVCCANFQLMGYLVKFIASLSYMCQGMFPILANLCTPLTNSTNVNAFIYPNRPQELCREVGGHILRGWAGGSFMR